MSLIEAVCSGHLFYVFKWLNHGGYSKNNNSHKRRISPVVRKQQEVKYDCALLSGSPLSVVT